MTSNFENSRQSLLLNSSIKSWEMTKHGGLEDNEINEKLSTIPRKLSQKFDLLYKAQQFEVNKTGREFSSLGNYFGWKAKECEKARKEFCKTYQMDLKNNELGVLSAEESQASTPNQCKKLEKSKNLERKQSEKGKNCKKNQEGLRKLMTSQSFSPDVGEICTKEKSRLSPKPSVNKKSSDRSSFQNSSKNLKEFQKNCHKVKPNSNQSNETRIFEPQSTVSLFQKSYSDLSKCKNYQKDLVSNNLLHSSKSIKGEKSPGNQGFSNNSPKSTKIVKKDLKFFSFSPKPSSNFDLNEKITEFSSFSPKSLKAKKVPQNKESLQLSPRSEKVLIEKLTREFNSLIPQSSQESTTVTYTTYINILKGLHLVLDSSKTQDNEKILAVQLWESLSSDLKLEKSKLLSSILSILRLKFNTTSISSQDSENLHKKFFLFYSNRVSFVSNVKSPLKPCEFSFHPKINENSKHLISSVSSESSRAEKRYEKISPSSKTLKLEAEKKKTEDEECTFRPKVNNFLVHKESERLGETLSDEYQKLINKNLQRTQALFELASVVQEKRKKMQKKEKNFEGLAEVSFFQQEEAFYASQGKKNLKNEGKKNNSKEIQGLDRTFHVSLNQLEQDKDWKDQKAGDGWDGLKTKEIRLDPRLVESFREIDSGKDEKFKTTLMAKNKKDKTTDKSGKGKDLQLALANSREETLKSLDQL